MAIIKYGVNFNGSSYSIGSANPSDGVSIEYPEGTEVAKLYSSGVTHKDWEGLASKGNMKIGSVTKNWENSIFPSDLDIILSVVDADGYVLYTSGSGTFTVPPGVTSFTVYLIGGGGGGGRGKSEGSSWTRVYAGGGGGGGYLTSATFTEQTPGTSYDWSVGGGGSRGYSWSEYSGYSGGTTTFGSYSAGGGGGGYLGSSVSGTVGHGGSGGSGGGNGGYRYSDSEGEPVGDHYSGYGGSNGGNGEYAWDLKTGYGDGVSKYVTFGGSSHLYCGGGGGGAASDFNGTTGRSSGGSGGGGQGGYASSGNADSGTANTGGGGGGGGKDLWISATEPGDGGSGLIIITW